MVVSNQLQQVRMRSLDPEDPKPFSILHPTTINENVVKAEYAVRGQLYNAAVARSKAGKRVILTNVGNPHALGQKPITFFRQVLALVNYPALMEDPAVAAHFKPDVILRAKTYIEKVPGGTGAYQDSRGNEYIRSEIAGFLEERDGYPAGVEDIFMTDGASQAISLCLLLTIRGRSDGILTPVPQYPLYSATIEIRNGTKCGYYLDEDNNWQLSIKELQRSVDEARRNGINPRGIVIINPGNPTGQCLTHENMIDIVKFCKRERLVIFADEVYQTNVYHPTLKFISFRKVIMDMGRDGADVELFSFNTVSKGAVGECGRRGAYFQCQNIHPGVTAEIYKVLSTNLSCNVDGQLVMGMMVNPPRPGDASYDQFKAETEGILSSLARRAKIIADAFNQLEGVTCNSVDGALYCYPQMRLPNKAVEAAKAKGYAADVLYCLELLDETGICCIPGSGFGQPDGTFHLRTTILPPEEQFDEIVTLFTNFHKNFMKKYGDSFRSYL
eukprot:Plantae.Rhodophyta-Purpureofilum_apyrenoidigerum.ctg15299.p1 GENE.Plantae.Rhodophyta-Purpureofilum_apyrenoidigerum.ctg15299~~Plantae.Rhodophyta-Purpureofilum_apyrenoidigerum.ctg15299.p1  ORF type:complete len:500 (+),score=82.46 Plantae.Rhodophyta-Purpureofilum_apyrenoidigerum.ctg15299:66-1565(+)